MNIIPSILYFIALWIITTTFFNNFYQFKNRLEQKYVWNSTTTILSKNFLNFKEIKYTGDVIIPPSAFSWVWEEIYIKLDTGVDISSWLEDYTTNLNVRKNLTWMCLKYLPESHSLFYICKLQNNG